MNTIKQRAHEYAQEHYLKNGVSIMRAYAAGARDERRYFIKPLRVKIFVSGKLVFKPFDFVKFSYGYTKRTMTFKIDSITIGKGKPEWGAPTEDVFIIKLGKKV